MKKKQNKKKVKQTHSQEQMGDKGYTTSSPSSVAKKSDYTGMSESNQKHTPDTQKGFSNNEEVIDIEYSSSSSPSQNKRDEPTRRYPEATKQINPPVDNHPETPRGKNKALWVIGIIWLIILLMDVSFIAYSVHQKDFNSTVNVQNPVTITPTNNYTIVNNLTTVVNVDPEIMTNITRDILAIKNKLNITNSS